MKKLLRNLRRKASGLLLRFIPSKHTWSEKSRERGMMKSFRRHRGYAFDIHNPVTFTEKLQWYKIHYTFPGIERVVDKYLFKDYIKEKLGDGFTVPLYGAWDSIDALEKDYDSLPEAFVLKSTLQSDGKCIKVIRDKSAIKFADIREELTSWLAVKNTLINSFCSAYYGATPRILAEKYIEGMNDAADYKVFCFDGEPYCLYTASYDASSSQHFSGITFYDTAWNKLDVMFGGAPNPPVDKPKRLADMLSLARTLSKPFPFVRVDFFETDDFLYVAELTLYPSGGLLRFDPPLLDEEMGRRFVLPT